jgi:hypothetical protein
MQTGGAGDSTSWGSPFFGHISKGLCNNNGKDPAQDCTLLAGRVGVMWAEGPNANKIADPSNGKTIGKPSTKGGRNANIKRYLHSSYSLFQYQKTGDTMVFQL